MDLKKVVAFYANKVEGKVEIDLKAFAQDPEARSLFLEAVLDSLKAKRNVCVFVPAFRNNHHLGPFINELALKLQREVLVTGDVKKLNSTLARCPLIKEVVIIKQAFSSGEKLAAQVAAVKAAGRKVCVLCLVAHSKEKLESFAATHGVEVKTLVYSEEI